MRELPPMPGVSLVEPQGAFYAFMQIDGITDSAAFAMRATSRERARARARVRRLAMPAKAMCGCVSRRPRKR